MRGQPLSAVAHDRRTLQHYATCTRATATDVASLFRPHLLTPRSARPSEYDRQSRCLDQHFGTICQKTFASQTLYSKIQESPQETFILISYFQYNNNNNNFLCANILEDQAQWRDKTKGLSNCVNVEQCVSR